MKRRFPIESDQLELLCEFAKGDGLNSLSKRMAKDPSVISRRLQRLAADFPVIEKQNRTWKLTSLGRKIVSKTESYLHDIWQALPTESSEKENSINLIADDPTLLIINAQRALLGEFEGKALAQVSKNILSILELFRSKGLSVIHIRHLSSNPNSPFFKGSESSEFINSISPEVGEITIEKSRASGFADTELNDVLTGLSTRSLIITGFTGNECIDATARDSKELGYKTTVVKDASASLQITDSTGEVIESERIHELMMANLAYMHCKVINTSHLIY